MDRAAKHDVIVVSDSDVIVERDCLAQLVAPLADAGMRDIEVMATPAAALRKRAAGAA